MSSSVLPNNPSVGLVNSFSTDELCQGEDVADLQGFVGDIESMFLNNEDVIKALKTFAGSMDSSLEQLGFDEYRVSDAFDDMLCSLREIVLRSLCNPGSVVYFGHEPRIMSSVVSSYPEDLISTGGKICAFVKGPDISREEGGETLDPEDYDASYLGRVAYFPDEDESREVRVCVSEYKEGAAHYCEIFFDQFVDGIHARFNVTLPYPVEREISFVEVNAEIVSNKVRPVLDRKDVMWLQGVGHVNNDE